MKDPTSLLNKSPVDHSWVIQDLATWPEKSKLIWTESEMGISYVHLSGHPAPRRHPLFILSNEGKELSTLIDHIPDTPFVIRETAAEVLPLIASRMPKAEVFLEQRMTTNQLSFKPFTFEGIRRLTEADAGALAEFSGAPPHATQGMKAWLQGAVIYAQLENSKITSLASTVVRTRDVWLLAGIETKPEFRGRGLAKAVTSALTQYALEQVATVSLTVLKDNLPAIAVYKKLGFTPREDQIWINNQAGSRPTF
jgi:RimJ/RimL family protein N-acetyltransferase